MSDNKESLKNTFGMALAICLVCSVLVSTAAVLLKPIQDKNKTQEKRKNILIAGGLIKEKEKANLESVFSGKIEPLLIDLKTGNVLPSDQVTGPLNPDTFDIKSIIKEPGTSETVPDGVHNAKLKRVPTRVLVYKIKENNQVVGIILPVYGKGLWSTMYGFISLNRDLKTVRGFTFYEHGETPGLGGEVDNSAWKAFWKGKVFFDREGHLKLSVIKGKANPGSQTEIDGLSGATLTTRGVDDMLEFWFGEKGYYRPFLNQLDQVLHQENPHE